MPEHTVRPLTPGDAEEASGVLRELERSLGYPGVSTPAQLLDWWRHTDLADRSWAIAEDGRLVAFAWLRAHGDVAQADGAVAPHAQGRGLGSRLCELLERKARELRLPTVHQHGLAADTAARALFEALGYREARRFYEMAIELDAPPPEPSWPEGIVPRPFRPGDARAFHDAIAESFRGQWGFVALPFAEWKRLRVDEADTSLYVVAMDGAQIAGFARCDEQGASSGIVGMLGVRPGWRQRGLGRALLLHALRAFHDRGARHVSLDVDADNPTGATRLYESVGMTVQVAVVVYARVLDHLGSTPRPG